MLITLTDRYEGHNAIKRTINPEYLSLFCSKHSIRFSKFLDSLNESKVAPA
jgi:hypothetical protein